MHVAVGRVLIAGFTRLLPRPPTSSPTFGAEPHHHTSDAAGTASLAVPAALCRPPLRQRRRMVAKIQPVGREGEVAVDNVQA
jgi:hypothetical protein